MNEWRTQVRKSDRYQTACAIFVFCAATAITSPAQTFTSLASFAKTDGNAPYIGSLVQGTDGNLYGTTELGGSRNAGTVFRVATDGTLTSLYSFCAKLGCVEGSGPYTGVVLATDGNFYGTNPWSGAYSNGTVYKMTPAGVLTALYGFCQQSGCPNGGLPIAALVLGSDGKLYGTDEGGGTNNVGTIFRITTAGVLTTLHSFINTDGATPAAAMLQANDGNFYGTTSYGGAHIACSGFFLGCGTVFKMTPAGVLTTLHSFAGAGDGNWPVGGLVQGADGSLYGTTKLGGVRNSACSFGCGTIFKITTSGTLTTLHRFDGTEAGFSTSPLLLATDGNFYGTTGYGGSTVCSQGCGTVFQITPSGTFTILHSFGLSDGANPAGGLVQATNGILYGTTASGGSNRVCGGAYCGTVFGLDMGLGKFVETVPTAARTGAKVLILGSNLTGATAVTFDGTPATFKVVSATEITTNVPAGATTGTVQVTKPAGTLSSNVSFRVTQ